MTVHFRMESLRYILETITHYLDGEPYRFKDEAQMRASELFEMAILRNRGEPQCTQIINKKKFAKLDPNNPFDSEPILGTKCYLVRSYEAVEITTFIQGALKRSHCLKQFPLQLNSMRYLAHFHVRYPSVPLQLIEDVGKIMGSGSYGFVYSINEREIIKIDSHINNITDEKFRRRAIGLSEFRPHSSINRFQGICYVLNERKWGFIFEKIQGTIFTLYDFSMMTFDEKRRIAIDLVEGADHFESHSLEHGDLSSHTNNVMIREDKRAIIIDYEKEVERRYDGEEFRRSNYLFRYFKELFDKEKALTNPLFQKFNEKPFEEYGWRGLLEDLRILSI